MAPAAIPHVLPCVAGIADVNAAAWGLCHGQSLQALSKTVSFDQVGYRICSAALAHQFRYVERLNLRASHFRPFSYPLTGRPEGVRRLLAA